MNELVENLEKFGLSQKEAKAYLACLELGESSANDISLKSSLPRTLTYDLLERLIDLGIVGYTIKENKKYFHAVNPAELLNVLKEKEENLKKVLPMLNELHKTKGVKRPRVEIYEGIEGMKTVMNEILRSGVKEFYAYGSSKSSIAVFPAFIEEWHERRAKQGVFMKAIYNNTAEAHERVRSYAHTFKKVAYRFMPITVHSPTAVIIYSDKVVLQSWTKDPFAVVIESNEMAANQKRYFDELWKLAKK